MRPQAEMNKIALEMDSPADPQRVEGDRLSLRTAFTNLISNGIRFNHEGGSVLIKVKEQGNDVVIEVSDSGIGIREEDIPFVFDEFFRVRNSETHHIAGSGLGLSITKKIVEAHCGSIRAESEIGKGTTFQVVLPKPRE
jgi:signal transduction histidine kinase